TLSGYVDDMSAPVTISVDGKALITAMPTAQPGGVPVGGQVQVTWTPQTAGVHTVSAQQGSQSQTVSVQIVDTNSPQAWLMRLEDYLRQLACQTGSTSGTAGCMTGGIS
ncbi:hypothetical protein, partial [Nocardia sp. NPDC004722]